MIASPSDSDTTPIKKKSKAAIRQRAAISLSSSSDENENNQVLFIFLSTHVRSFCIFQTLTNRADASPTASRIHIQRSSSEDSNSNKNKRSRRRRKKSGVSNERSSILKEIKRKNLEKKSSKSSTDSDDMKKSVHTDDDDSESTSNDEGASPSKGRKNIRKILDDKELDIQTKNAIAAERERRKRIAENQQKYNDTLLEQSSSLPIEQTPNSNPRLILELDKTTNEPLIEVSSKLVEQMKVHQCDGVRFLWNNVFESLDAIQKKKHAGNGCILAHCMGLGKTLQVISFIHTIFNYNNLTNVKTCLVLCPINAGKTFFFNFPRENFLRFHSFELVA